MFQEAELETKWKLLQFNISIKMSTKIHSAIFWAENNSVENVLRKIV